MRKLLFALYVAGVALATAAPAFGDGPRGGHGRSAGVHHGSRFQRSSGFHRGFHRDFRHRDFRHRDFRHRDFGHHGFRHHDFRHDGFRHHGFRHHHRSPSVFIGLGAPYYPYYYPYYRYPYYWYGPLGYGWWWPGPYVVERTIVREESVYAERGSNDEAEPLSDSEGEGSWYYCPSEGAYYPEVERCPEPWIPVPARPQ